MTTKKILIWAVILILVGAGAYYYYKKTHEEAPVPVVEEPEYIVEDNYNPESFELLGTSTEDRAIRAFKFGNGDKKIVYIGAIHGGYEWNTALLSYELIDYLTANPDVIPDDIQISVIPVANPDGLYKVMGTSGRFFASDAPQFDYADEITYQDLAVRGRFNANEVDLNRNFDCNWKSDAIWRTYDVSGGTAPFSEPESAALRDYLLREKPVAVIVFHSASNGVYTSFCNGDALPGTEELLKTYSEASGYPLYNDYPYYEVTGDIGDWLSTVDIPAISVELSTHTAIEWDRNKAALEALLKLYSGTGQSS